MKIILLIFLLAFSAKGFSQYDLLILKNYSTGKIVFITEGKMIKVIDASNKVHKGILRIKCDSAQCHNPLLILDKDSVYLDNIIMIRTKPAYSQVYSGVLTVGGSAMAIEGSYLIALGMGLNPDPNGVVKYSKSVSILNGGILFLGGASLTTAGLFFWKSFTRKYSAGKWEFFARSPIAQNIDEPLKPNQTSIIAP